MKKLFLLIMVLGISTTGFSQIRDTLIWFKTEVGKVSAFSPSFKTLATQAMNADDCTPPKGCDIVDPWTCECTGGTKDPWGSEAKTDPERLSSFQAFEKAIARGAGKNVLPKSLVATARKKYPGDSPKAVHYRFRMYMAAMKK